MAEKGFEPLTSQLGIAGTSFRLQLGEINDKWAARILKGKDIIDSYVFKDEDISESGAPNQNLIVGYVLRTLTIPNINPYGIMKTTQALVKQALANKEKKKIVAPISETKEIELEKVPEKELKRPKATGWVKEEEPKGLSSEDEKRAAFQARLKAKKEQASAESEKKEAKSAKPAVTADVKTVKTTRKLPSIPGGTTTEEKVKTTPVETKTASSEEESKIERDIFCPYCGKDLDWKFCPYCGKPLPHAHGD
ncbi:MAG: hypothetical protein ACTSR8_16675 [Promethearchaeota archaeon]